MFRLHKTRPAKSGEKTDFKFSNFKVVQIPKGWDRLFVSVISVENGKTMAKTSKATVKNGTCQWTETLSESIWFSLNEVSKEMEDCVVKLIVATGSARSGILGEATVNMTSYVSSTASAPASLPLKKCNHGTILQVKIHCLTPKPAKLMDEESKQTNSDEGNNNPDPTHLSFSSDEPMAVGSQSSQELASTPHQEVVESRVTSFSTSDSNHSYDSAESTIGRESLSPVSNLSADTQNLIQRKEFPASQDSLPNGNCHPDDHSQSNDTSFGSQIMGSENNFSDNQLEVFASPVGVTDSSKNLLEAAEKTIQELHAEAKMWERNAQKLRLDLDIMRKEYSDQSKNQADLDVELSATIAERDGLRKEVEQMKLLMEMAKQATLEDSKVQDEGVVHMQKELENEVKFLEESNSNLEMQLKKSQEANVELVSVLHELEETIEKQRVEMENSSAHQQSKESENKHLQAKVELLEKALKDKKDNALPEIEEEYNSKLAAKDREIIGLKLKLSESLKEGRYMKVEPWKGGDAHLVREIEALKVKLEELEKDCNELTDENLELLLKLKGTNNNFGAGEVATATDFSSNELSDGTKSEMSEDKSKMLYLEEKLKKKILREIQSEYNSYIQELECQKVEMEVEVTELSKELAQKRTEIQRLEAIMASKEEDNSELRRNQSELEDEVSNLQKELERVKHELQIHLSELEDENEQLSLRLSSLETEQEDLKDERDSTRLQLEDSKSLANSLKNEVEAQKGEMEKQLQDMHDQWLASQEKCEYLKRENRNLQATAEILIEECNSLKKSAGNLKKENSELNEHCAHLEAKLRLSEKSLTDCNRKVEILEENLTWVMEDFASKEKSLTSELDAIHDKNKKLEAKLKLEEASWNQMYLEKANEVENLRQEVENLRKQLSTMYEENEKTTHDALHEISGLHADKVRLESALQEAESRMKYTETELKKLQAEATTKVEDLLYELAGSRKNQETLMAEHEKVLKLLETYKSSEGKLKTIVNDLELKLTVSEYERQQASEKSTNMKVQLLKIENLQDEISALINERNAVKSDKEKLEASLSRVSGECKDVKAEKNSFLEQISTLQKVVSQLEDYKNKKVALEKKIMEMESELMAKEALLMQDAEFKNELHQSKRTNRQFQQQIKQLQEEKDELLIKTQILEEKLKQKILEEKQKLRQPNSRRNQHKREDNNYNHHDRSPRAAAAVDTVSNLPDNDLANAMDANNKHRVRPSRLSEGQRSQSNTSRKSSIEGEVVPKEKYELTKTSLEAELEDIQERYLHMSLKYAEVEAQREELVMKLRGVKSMRRWFSNTTN